MMFPNALGPESLCKDHHRILEELLTLADSPWGRSTEGGQHIAALLLSWWQLTGLALGMPPSFLLLHSGNRSKRCRELLWRDLHAFRTGDPGPHRSHSRKSARVCLRLMRSGALPSHPLGAAGNQPTGRIESGSFRAFAERLAPRAWLQRLRTVSDPDIGVLAPQDFMVSFWIGADSQAKEVAPYLAAGALEGNGIPASLSRPEDSRVLGSVMGGVGMSVWRRHLAQLVLEQGVPLLALKTATSAVEPPSLDPRLPIALRLGALNSRGSVPPHPFHFRFRGHTDHYARILQRHLACTHPGHLQHLLGTLRMIPGVAAQLVAATRFFDDVPPGLVEALTNRACKGITAGSLGLLPEVWERSEEPEDRQLATILSFVRQKKVTTRREIQRKARLDAVTRDRRLDRLSRIGLVQLNEREIRNVPTGTWIDHIPKLFDFPEIPDR